MVDLGCGPGHWTARLAEAGVRVRGTDLSPAFVATARTRFPGLPFDVVGPDDPVAPDGSLDGVLAWYSLIHTPPAALPAALSAVRRAVRVGGHVLVGFQVAGGAVVEAHPHRVTPSWRWPVDAFAGLAATAGLAEVGRVVRPVAGDRQAGEAALLLVAG